MQVRHYELFLDESGNFTDGRPSLIGGVFCSSGQLTEELALQLLGESLSEVGLDFPESGQVHGTELPKDVFAPFALSLIRNMLAKEIQPIVFENQERIEIVDPDTTYIHLVAEGITRLFSALSCAGRETALSVTAARRMVEDKQHQSALRAIPREEYLYRIKEHMATAMLRLGVREYRDQWSLDGFRLGSARTEYTLMLADVICHAWYSAILSLMRKGQNSPGAGFRAFSLHSRRKRGFSSHCPETERWCFRRSSLPRPVRTGCGSYQRQSRTPRIPAGI